MMMKMVRPTARARRPSRPLRGRVDVEPPSATREMARRHGGGDEEKRVPPGVRNQQQRGSKVVVPHHGGRQLSWYSHGGLASRQMPQVLSVRVRLLLIGPRAGMRVARGGSPSFGALRRDNTPTAACLSASIWGVHRAVQSAPGAVSGISATGI